jgi:hypothetical protein
MKRSVALVALAVSIASCTEGRLTTPTPVTPLSPASSSLDVARSGTDFVVGPLALVAITRQFPDGRVNLRDLTLTGPVSGDLTGTASLTLNANLDAPGGSGPAWGEITIVTASGEWHGTVVGSFSSARPAPGIQLFSRVILHGPDGQKLTAECNETSATSEILVCSGETLAPHG